MFRLIRPADLLVADIELVNLRVVNGFLVTVNPSVRAQVVVHLPPQHISEPSSPAEQEDLPYPAFASGGAKLTFRIDSHEVELASGLLDWSSKTFEPYPETVIEFPNRLRISPDSVNGWICRAQPLTHEGRTELWSARLGYAGIRAYEAVGGLPERPGIVPADQDVRDLVTLTSTSGPDISVAAVIQLTQHGVESWYYRPEPFEVQLLMLTALGASVRLKGSWKYPYVGVDPAWLESLGVPLPPQVTAYDHVAGTGRDQYVRIVKRGFLSTGHRASVVEVVRREFNSHYAGLVTSTHVVPTEPELDYSPEYYPGQGREMPLRKLRIVDQISPEVSQDLAGTWGWVGDPPFLFTMVGTDALGNQVNFRLPQIFIPDSATGQMAAVKYQTDHHGTWQVPFGQQVMALGPERGGDPGGATTFPVESLTLTLTPAGHPLGHLPMMGGATVRIPAAERLTGKPVAATVSFDPDYLGVTFDAVSDPAGAFLKVTQDLRTEFSGDQAGGLARPTAVISKIATRAGAIPDTGDMAGALGDAKLLGSIALKDLLGAFNPNEYPVPVDPAAVKAALADTGRRLPVPILRAQDLADGTHEVRYLWRPVLLTSTPPPPLEFTEESRLTLDARVVRGDGTAQPLDSTVTGELLNFSLAIDGLVRLSIDRLHFLARFGRKPEITASGFRLGFEGKLAFVQTLKDKLPADGFSKFPAIEATPDGISAGYSLTIPDVGVGVFSMHNFALAAALHIPFNDEPFTFRFAIAERQHPCTLTVSMFGGGAYFALLATGDGLRQVEAAFEFGGSFSLDLGVASGGVTVMAGIYINWTPAKLEFDGYLRCSGQLEVLGLIAVSVEFYLQLGYVNKDGGGEVAGQASITVGVRVLFFSTSVTLTVHRSFAGAAGDPTFDDLVAPADWAEYCEAFA
jgi:hypothetical protein